MPIVKLLIFASMPRSEAKENFIKKAKEVHGNFYDYSKVEYVNNHTKVCIICPIHGEFWQEPNNHTHKHGCPICQRDAQKTLVFGFGINDYNTPVKINGKHIDSYLCWLSMLKRCFSKDALKKEPCYGECVICEEWKYFSNFKKWFDDPNNGYIKGLELDKDILVRGNKIYSPQTCCFVPQDVNKLIMKNKKIRGKYKIGVYKRKDSHRFHASWNDPISKIRTDKTFSTEQEAFIAYKEGKEDVIKRVADKYYKEGLITKKVHNALYAYEVMEDD